MFLSTLIQVELSLGDDEVSLLLPTIKSIKTFVFDILRPISEKPLADPQELYSEKYLLAADLAKLLLELYYFWHLRLDRGINYDPDAWVRPLNNIMNKMNIFILHITFLLI